MARIPESPEEIFAEFVEDYQQVYGTDLQAVVLYGSGAKGEYVPKVSDINFLIVLSQSGIDRLEEALDLVQKWRKRNVAVPLFLTLEYIESALDAFPIEFLGLQRHHKVVFGEDPLQHLEIKKDDLRLQVERELRGKLLHLREGFLSTGQDRTALAQFLGASVAAFASIFEGLLWLKGVEIPRGRTEVLAKTAQEFGLDGAVFTQVVNVRLGQWHGSKVQLQEIAKRYIAQIKQLVEAVDKM